MCVNGVTSYRETAWYINRTHCLTFKQPNDENTLVNLKAKQSFLRDAMKAKVKNIFVSGRSNNPKFIWWLLDYLFFWSEFVLYSSKLLKFCLILFTYQNLTIILHCIKSSCLYLFFNNFDGKKKIPAFVDEDEVIVFLPFQSIC